jgi:hypothetical protein
MGSVSETTHTALIPAADSFRNDTNPTITKIVSKN